MARSAFCTTCSRTVYIEIEDSLVCPVCSSPILEVIDAQPVEQGDGSDGAAQSADRK
jgi:Zn finger protein HypA/HybF involved in hydrogenase expression